MNINFNEELAGKMYDRYCISVGGKSFNGDQLPNWKEFRRDESKRKQSDAWVDTAETAHAPDGSFSKAVKWAKWANKKICRKVWNGKGMFVYHVPENSYPVERNTSSAVKGMFENDMVPYGAYLAMKTATGEVVPWLASQTDILAEDWEVID